MPAERATGWYPVSGNDEQAWGDYNQAVDQYSHSSAAESWSELCDLPPGMVGVVRKVNGDANFTTTLASRGLTIGAQLSVLRNSGRGLLLIMVRDTFLALGRTEAAKIKVEVIATEEEPA
jgi:Fe2+ transport system protein FeoA